MTQHRFFVEGERIPPLTTRDFVWNSAPTPSSFRTSVDPGGRALGVTSQGAVELLRLAFAAYLVDRTEPRPMGWARELELTIPVADVTAWRARATGIERLLDFLTGDIWSLSFGRHRGAPITRTAATHRSEHDLVSLFSGGMDSFAGAALATTSAERLLLVGHWNWTLTSSAQSDAREALTELTGASPEFRAVHVGRSAKQLDGQRFRGEASSRSRSLLFLAIGLALASGTRATELWVPENGWGSLNVPLNGSRRSSLSTRTTHPGLLDEIGGLVRDLGLDIVIRNPWEGFTKGDLVAWAVGEWGQNEASAAFSATNSCAKSDMRFRHLAPNTHCGVCYACLVRRAAFIAAGIEDGTAYAERRYTGADRDEFLRTRRRDYAAVQSAIGRGGFAMDDILALNLPERIGSQSALDLANRGLAELNAVEIA